MLHQFKHRNYLSLLLSWKTEHVPHMSVSEKRLWSHSSSNCKTFSKMPR